MVTTKSCREIKIQGPSEANQKGERIFVFLSFPVISITAMSHVELFHRHLFTSETLRAFLPDSEFS